MTTVYSWTDYEDVSLERATLSQVAFVGSVVAWKIYSDMNGAPQVEHHHAAILITADNYEQAEDKGLKFIQSRYPGSRWHHSVAIGEYHHD